MLQALITFILTSWKSSGFTKLSGGITASLNKRLKAFFQSFGVDFEMKTKKFFQSSSDRFSAQLFCHSETFN